MELEFAGSWMVRLHMVSLRCWFTTYSFVYICCNEFFNGFHPSLSLRLFCDTPGLSYFDVEIMGLSPVLLSTRYDCLCPSLFCLIGILPPICLRFLFVNFLESWPLSKRYVVNFHLWFSWLMAPQELKKLREEKLGAEKQRKAAEAWVLMVLQSRYCWILDFWPSFLRSWHHFIIRSCCLGRVNRRTVCQAELEKDKKEFNRAKKACGSDGWRSAGDSTIFGIFFC